MAISKEDKHDVKTHMGKALANKVSKVTKDNFPKGIKNIGAVVKSMNKTGSYASPAAKKAISASDAKYSAYEKERKERYKREGISE